MPLTPLGRQLRLVLASLRDVTCHDSIGASSRAKSIFITTPPTKPPSKTVTTLRRLYHHGATRQRSAAAALATEERPSFDWSASVIRSEDGNQAEPVPSLDLPGEPRVKRQNPTSNSSSHVYNYAPVAETQSADWDRYHTRRTGDRLRAFLRIESLHDMRDEEHLTNSGDAASLEKILAEGMQQQARAEPGQAEWDDPFNTSSIETEELLARLGYSTSDVTQWAKILLAADSLEAAILLAQRTSAHGYRTTPYLVLQQLLRRPYVSARALRTLVEQAEDMLTFRTQEGSTLDHEVFATFLHLMHHARKVWPASMDRIAQMLLSNLDPVKYEDGTPEASHLQDLTHVLNKAMRLIVVPTAIEPVRNNVHQQAALVRVLQFMESHRPTLQITREGYRAVILLQLPQRKTDEEQQWAELKSLSWPPWKEERTAMDSFITAETQGMSKAAGTLMRMREAGYHSLGWERTAMVYAGWDVDRTPTIQTLVHLGVGGSRFHSGTALWAARIMTTRTAQEAWAAYLAYEDATTQSREPPEQEVQLAILRRLQKEAIRQRGLGHRERSRDSTEAERDLGFRRLFPGDTREVWPLPPSTHLYTYTRSEPPTMDGFYRQMRHNGLTLRGHCLAFLVAKADTLGHGIEYLIDSDYDAEILRTLLDLNHDYDINNVPMPLYMAFLKLLCLHSRKTVSKFIPPSINDALHSGTRKKWDVLTERRLTRSTGMAHAIALLQWRRPLHRPSYNTILEALGHESTAAGLKSVEGPDIPIYYTDKPEADKEQEALRGAVTAHRLGRRVLSLLRDVHMDLDVDGFRALCQITENAAAATWTIVHEAEGREHKAWLQTTHLAEALEWLRSTNHAKRLQGEFRILVGDDTAAQGDHTATPEERTVNARPHDQMPLEIPSFSILHAYVRAQGWMADYQGMLDTVRWMRLHADALAERRERDRNGRLTMFRTLCALRAFLERSWLADWRGTGLKLGDAVPEQHDGRAERQVIVVGLENESAADAPRPRIVKQLRRLRAPAPREVVEEVQDLVESVSDWGGWPSDDDVERYCRNVRFQRLV